MPSITQIHDCTCVLYSPSKIAPCFLITCICNDIAHYHTDFRNSSIRVGKMDAIKYRESGDKGVSGSDVLFEDRGE